MTPLVHRFAPGRCWALPLAALAVASTVALAGCWAKAPPPAAGTAGSAAVPTPAAGPALPAAAARLPVFASAPCAATPGPFADLVGADASALLGTSQGEDGVCWGLLVAERDEFNYIAALRLVRQSPAGRLELRLQPLPEQTDGYDAAELATGDLDGDGRQEAQLSLTWGRSVTLGTGEECEYSPCYIETQETVQERLLVTACDAKGLAVVVKRITRYESTSSASEEIDQVPGAEEGAWSWELPAGTPPRLISQQQRLSINPKRLPGLLDPRTDPSAAGPAAPPLTLDLAATCAAAHAHPAAAPAR